MTLVADSRPSDGFAFDGDTGQYRDAIRRWIARRRDGEPNGARGPEKQGATVDQLHRAIEHQSRLVETVAAHLAEQRREIARLETRSAAAANGDASGQKLAQLDDALAKQRLHMTALAVAVQRLTQLLAARLP